MRTLAYAWWYQKEAGISDTPWNCPHIFTIASGDDCVMFVAPQYADHLKATIERLST